MSNAKTITLGLRAGGEPKSIEAGKVKDWADRVVEVKGCRNLKEAVRLVKVWDKARLLSHEELEELAGRDQASAGDYMRARSAVKVIHNG